MKDDGKQPAEQPISDYAPPQRPVAVVEPTKSTQPYLTAEMIAPDGEVGDAMRLTRITGPALNQIGQSTADQLELVAISIVENARRGADQIIAEAQAQAQNMMDRAEAQADEMRVFAKSIRGYTDRTATTVSAFCSVAESTLGTMHALKAQFEPLTIEEARAEAETDDGAEAGDGKELHLPNWLGRKKK